MFILNFRRTTQWAAGDLRVESGENGIHFRWDQRVHAPHDVPGHGGLPVHARVGRSREIRRENSATLQVDLRHFSNNWVRIFFNVFFSVFLLFLISVHYPPYSLNVASMYLKLGRLYLGLEKQPEGVKALKKVLFLFSSFIIILLCSFLKGQYRCFQVSLTRNMFIVYPEIVQIIVLLGM